MLVLFGSLESFEIKIKSAISLETNQLAAKIICQDIRNFTHLDIGLKFYQNCIK